MIGWIIFGCILFLFLIWLVIEQHILYVPKFEVPLKELPREWDGLAVVHLSDLHHRHMGKGNCRIVKQMAKLRPDVIFITGDLVSRDFHRERECRHIEMFLTNLRKISPVYLSMGNHELELVQNGGYALLAEILKKTDCQMLDDRSISLPSKTPKEEPIYVAGASLHARIYRDENNGFRNLAPYSTHQLRKAIGPRQGFTILLAHNPFLLSIYEKWGADFVLSGHVHGGIIRLPRIGGLLSPDRSFFPVFDKGCYEKNRTQMYVSGGIGKLRLFNPPEMIFFYLKSE